MTNNYIFFKSQKKCQPRKFSICKAAITITFSCFASQLLSQVQPDDILWLTRWKKSCSFKASSLLFAALVWVRLSWSRFPKVCVSRCTFRRDRAEGSQAHRGAAWAGKAADAFKLKGQVQCHPIRHSAEALWHYEIAIYNRFYLILVLSISSCFVNIHHLCACVCLCVCVLPRELAQNHNAVQLRPDLIWPSAFV